MKTEWLVVNMDGAEVSRHRSYEAAERAADEEMQRFSRKQRAGSLTRAYLPRSVIHEPCGCVREGRYSTSWVSPGCTHVPAHDEESR